MKFRFCLPIVVLANLLSSFAALYGQQASSAVRIVDRVDESQRVTLRGNTHPAAVAANDRGRVAAEQPLENLVLVLSRDPEQQAAFERFVASQYDEKSPNYHQWLEPEEVGERFGPAEADVAAVCSWLTGRGFHVDEVAKDRLSIRFSGAVGDVESAFHVEIHKLTVKGVPHIANMSDPQIPAALAPVVVGVKALHDFRPRPMHRLGGQVTRDGKTGKWKRVRAGNRAAPEPATALDAQARPQFGVNDKNNGYLIEDVAPYDFAAIYNVQPLWTAGVTGSGQTIAVAGTSDINPSDIASFKSAFGLPAGLAPIQHQGVNGHDPGICSSTTTGCGTGDLIENSLDVEWSGAVAPAAQIVLVTSGVTSSNSTDDPIWDDVHYVIQNKTANILTISYGLCELAMGTAGNVSYYNLYQTAASEGIAVFVATGDQGSANCDAGGDSRGTPYPAEFGLSVSGLASTPYNTAVGGTDFNWCSPTATSCTAAPYWSSTNNATSGASALGYVPEIPWNDTCASPTGIAIAQYFAGQFGVGNPANGEEACNFILAYYQSIYFYWGQDFSSLIDTVGGSGGKSSCIVNDGSTVASCLSSITSTGSQHGSIPLVSDGWPKPKWQAGVTGIPTDGVRDIPDVSFFASAGFNNSAYLICVSEAGSSCIYNSTSENTAQEVGGTSVGTPAMAGVMALIDQKAGSAQGNPNAVLYALAAGQSYGSCSAETVTASTACYFNDIDTDTNTMPCDATNGSPNCKALYSGDYIGLLDSGDPTLGGYNAGTGYDLVTGLGSLNVANIVNAWSAAAVPKASLSSKIVSFPATPIGAKSSAVKVTLTNSGLTTLTLSRIAIGGAGAADFTQTNNCGRSLAAGANCTIGVTFAPKAVGKYAASLTVTDNAHGSPQSVSLSGQGVKAPAVSLSATSVRFPNTKLGNTATAGEIHIKNTGTATLTIKSMALGGTNPSSFSLASSCGASLAAGSSCAFKVGFQPKSPGVLKASVLITDNATGSPHLVSLSGEGIGPAISLSPASVSFPATKVGSSATAVKVILKNTGTAALTIKSMTLGGTNALSFSLTSSCGSSLAAGLSCAFAVGFKPKSTGALAAKIQIADNAAGSPQTVALGGTGK